MSFVFLFFAWLDNKSQCFECRMAVLYMKSALLLFVVSIFRDSNLYHSFSVVIRMTYFSRFLST